LVGDVTYRNVKSPQTVWFDVPAQYANELSVSGNPWLVSLLPIAAQRGESIAIDLPVDRTLVENTREHLRIWQSWGWPPSAGAIQIDADVRDASLFPVQSPPTRTVVPFSGGVDSFFTVLSHDAGTYPERDYAIDDLLFAWGFDIRLNRQDVFIKVSERIRRA